jgi:hypothetical protein
MKFTERHEIKRILNEEKKSARVFARIVLIASKARALGYLMQGTLTEREGSVQLTSKY